MRKDVVFTWAVAAVVVAASGASASVIKIVAKKKNGSAIAPTSTLSVASGDTIETEILLTGFGADVNALGGLRSYQVEVAGRFGVQSGSNSLVLPIGWDAPLDNVICTTNADCSIGLTCIGLRCTGPAHFPSAGAFIDKLNPDWPLANADLTNTFVAVPSLDYTFVATDNDGIGYLDDGRDYYLGTYKLKVQPAACGIFTFDINSDNTFYATPDNAFFLTGTRIPLTLDAGPCPLLGTMCSNGPPSCAIDARFERDPANPATEFGMSSICVQFDESPAALTTSDFEVSETPVVGGGVPGISLSTRQRRLTITFDSMIDLGTWTCVRHIASDRRYCLGHLPGDSDQSQTSIASDVNEVLAHMTGDVVLPDYACDIDRSGKCRPQDILASIDVLNGADGLAEWNGQSISLACPDRSGR